MIGAADVIFHAGALTEEGTTKQPASREENRLNVENVRMQNRFSGYSRSTVAWMNLVATAWNLQLGSKGAQLFGDQAKSLLLVRQSVHGFSDT